MKRILLGYSGVFKSILWGICFILGACEISRAQTTYTWIVGSDSWSFSNNWDQWATGTVPGAGDTAILANTGGYTVTYDNGASGTLGTLVFYQDGSSSSNATLQLNKSLTITTSATMYDTATGGGGYITLLGSSTLTIASGATFTLGQAMATAERNFTTINQATGYTGTGVDVYGTFTATGAVGGTWQPAQSAAFTFENGSSLKIESNKNGSTNGATRLIFNNTFTTTGTVVISATGDLPANSGIFFSGDVNIGSGTTISNFGTTNITFASLSGATSATTQNIKLGNLYNYQFRAQTSGYNATWNLTSTATSTNLDSSTMNNAIDSLYFRLAGNQTATLKLLSNLNLASGQTNFLASNFTNASGGTLNLDLNGHTYDMTTGSASATAFTGSYGTAVAGEYFKFSNSGASSIGSGNGIFKAPSFNFASSNVVVGDGVILQASAIGATNDLGRTVTDTGSAGISANSTFYYTGTGSTNLKSTNNVGIGKVIVGTSAGSSSTLTLSSAITANGDLTINTGSIFNLNGCNYTLGKDGTLLGASLFTSGTDATLENTSATGATLKFATDAAIAGKLSPGGDNAIGVLTTSGNGNSLIVDLNSATLFIDVLNLSAGGYDYISNSGGTTIKLAGSTIHVNFLDTSITNGTIDIFQGSTDFTTDGGTPTITSNLALDFSFNSATGELSFALVPESGTVTLLGMGACLLLAGGVFKRRFQKAF